MTPGGVSSEPFRVLRLAIDARRGRETNGIVFTSPRHGDGASTVAINYALVTALRQTSVLLVDADFYNPTLHRVFDLPPSPGLSEALRDGLDATDVAHSFWRYGPLSVVTAGAPLPRTADIASSPAMADFLRRAAQSYELLAIDAPPAPLAADASALAVHDGIGVVLVIRPGSRRRDVSAALQKLALTEARVLGMVLNRHGTPASFAA